MVSMRVKSESFLGTRESGPLPSKLLARLHEVNNVFESESHKKAVILALRERKSAGAGFSKKMNSLFCLWSNRLRDVFHVSTYLMFMRLAQEDALVGDPYGMECLFRFLSYGLEKSFRRELYLDFEDLALLQFKNGDLYGVEKYAAFWHYGGNKVVPTEIAPNTKLMHLTRVKYPTLASFKDNRYVEKEDPDFNPEVMQSHLGPEAPLSPAVSVMGGSDFLSEFSFDSMHDDLMFASSPHGPTLSASAPSFYPSAQMKPMIARPTRARSEVVVVKLIVQGEKVTVMISARSGPLPVQQQGFAPPSWRAARSQKRTQSGFTPQRDFLPAYGSYGRSPTGGTGRATTPARPVGQSWKGKRGHRFGRPRTEGATSDLGTSYGGSSYGMSPVGFSPMGCSGSYRGGIQRMNSNRLEEQEISRLREALEVSKKECAVATQRLQEWECLGFQ